MTTPEDIRQFARILETGDTSALENALQPECDLLLDGKHWKSRHSIIALLQSALHQTGAFFAIAIDTLKHSDDRLTLDARTFSPAGLTHWHILATWSAGKVQHISAETKPAKAAPVPPGTSPLTHIPTMVNLLSRPDTILVGWGTKDYYQREKALYLDRLDCLIDSDPDQQKKTIDGLGVFPPEHLLAYDPDKVLVIIFSSFFRDIETQLNALGIRHCTCPFTPRQLSYAARFLLQAYGAPQPSPSRQGLALHGQATQCAETLGTETQGVETQGQDTTGVVFQGPVDPNLTLPLVAGFRHMHPRIKIVVSTWQGTPVEHITALRQHADEILLLEDTPIPGDHNRNRQSYSTDQGIRAAAALGCRFVLKMRTDLWSCATDLFEMLAHAWAENPVSTLTKARGRLVVAQSYSRVFMPFHVSDLLMFGHVDDMLAFWSLPHNDPRAPSPDNLSLWDFCVEGGAPETAYGYAYCQKTMDTHPGDFATSLQWFSDHFVVLDDNTLQLFWYKLNFEQALSLPATLFSSMLWKTLSTPRAIGKLANMLDPQKLSMQEFRETLALDEARDGEALILRALAS